ncbi:S66 peptidase family protein [Rubrivirga sp.]|uniref:S66 peptidase family protein n=1 Tax=Rubrivirga sp. TaxID=1885344 RepID=UPI003C74BF11
MHRRRFLESAAAGLALAALSPLALASTSRVTRPARLRPGDTVGLVSPAGITYSRDDLEVARATFAALGLEVVFGDHVLARDGYLAGTDQERAGDVTAMFADTEVDALIALRGGWGCARILPHLDYDVIRANPKVLCGFSDVASLLLGVYAQTDLATFHGPNGISNFSTFTTEHFRSVVMSADRAILANPESSEDALVPRQQRTLTIRGGHARGRLVGGNLTVLSAMAGTPYIPDTAGHVLFVEDVGEAIYRIDRMLTQLGQAGVLEGVAGFVFGVCRNCTSDSGGIAGFTLEEVVRHHVEPLGVPAYMGASIGHTTQKLTVPIGIEAELDADAGTIRLLESAVL